MDRRLLCRRCTLRQKMSGLRILSSSGDEQRKTVEQAAQPIDIRAPWSMLILHSMAVPRCVARVAFHCCCGGNRTIGAQSSNEVKFANVGYFCCLRLGTRVNRTGEVPGFTWKSTSASETRDLSAY